MTMVKTGRFWCDELLEREKEGVLAGERAVVP
jgi:hypothetical protein